MAQVEQQAFPLELHPLDGEREQRATQRALRQWQRLRGNRRTPLFGEFRYSEEPPWDATQFLLKQDILVGYSVFILCGAKAAAAFGGLPVRKTLIEVAPEALREQMTADCETAIASAAPAGSEGWYRGPEQARVQYRYIFLPLEAALSRFGYIFGAYSECQRWARRAPGRLPGRGKQKLELRSVG
ncbi:MAG: hypothetical protein ACFCUQ_07500 [Kiloniellales bacterium]